MEKIYNKAVRDLIPKIIRAQGKECTVQQVSQEEFLKLMQQKLVEEVAEYQEEPSLEELADILEVVMAIVNLSGYTMADLEDVRKKKAEERGGFQERLVLGSVTE